MFCNSSTWSWISGRISVGLYLSRVKSISVAGLRRLKSRCTSRYLLKWLMQYKTVLNESRYFLGGLYLLENLGGITPCRSHKNYQRFGESCCLLTWKGSIRFVLTSTQCYTQSTLLWTECLLLGFFHPFA